MATKAGDLYVSIPSHALRRAVRQAAFDADTPIRRLVTDMLIAGLSERGYSVDDQLIYREGRKRHAILTGEKARTGPERVSA